MMQKFSGLDNIKSIYLHGDPGCGKSQLMYLFYESLDLPEDRKNMLHYNEFMLDIHEREHKVNKMLKGKQGDSINVVGNHFCEPLTFFCIDEF